MGVFFLFIIHCNLLLYVSSEAVYYDIVFRGASGKLGGTGSIYDLWVNNGALNTNIVAAKTVGSGYAGHFKSPEVDRWDLTTFTEVKMAVYKNGIEAKYFIFNAAGTTKMTWMSTSSLSSSSYNLNGQTFNFFSVNGDGERRFFINRNYDGCDKDYGWLVIPEATYCEWERKHAKPTILYHSGDTPAVNWLHGEEADEIAIYLGRSLSQVDPCQIDNPTLLPNLKHRAPYVTDVVVNDDTLERNWYSGGDYRIVTTELSPPGNKCGARKYIWMKETFPENNEESEKIMCIAENNHPCSITFHVKIKNCGRHYMYLLGKPLTDDTAYCFEISDQSDPCSLSDPSSVPDLENRRPSISTVSTSDTNLQTGWYTAHIFDIFTFKPRNNIACGTKNPMWMDDSIPDADGKIHMRKICIMDGSDGCKSLDYIHIKNCGSYRMYHLTATDVTDSAYCYDIKTESDENPPDFTPAHAKIEHDLRWEQQGKAEVPNLLFRCGFETDATGDWYYSVFFYVNDGFIRAPLIVKASNKSEAYVTEKFLSSINEKYRLGIIISCRVGTRTTATGMIGHLKESSGFYAGLKMVNKTIEIKRGEKDNLVYFYPTVPYGCYHYENAPQTCELDVQLVTKQSTNGCYNNALSFNGKCGTKITGVTKSDFADPLRSNQWNKTYSFKVQNSDTQEISYYLRHRQFTLQLETPSGTVDHAFWKSAVSEEAKVNVHESSNDFWMNRKCQLHCDPHILTLDGVEYDLQFAGTFMAYKHKSLPIEVQVEITSCYRSGRTPYCVCGLAVVVGRDVFRISTCHGEIIDYDFCEDGVLKAVTKNGNTYKIYLPTGAIVQAVRRGLNWDVDIRATVHDIYSSGLCGSFDNDRCNDIDPSPSDCRGSYRFYLYRDSPSIVANTIDSTKSFVRAQNFEVYDTLRSYPDASYQVCICPHTNKESNVINVGYDPVAECSYRDYATCDDGNKEIKCILHEEKRRRKRRSTEEKVDLSVTHHNIFVRSASFMSEAEARTKCESALKSSQTYSICSSLGVDSSDGEIEKCVQDLMLSGDESWILAADDRSNSACLTEIASNSTLQSENTEAVSLVQNITCPNSCSNHGVCEKGVCVCNDGFASDDCSYNLTAPLNVIGLTNDGLCDVRYGCDAIYINGKEFPSDRQYTCQFKLTEVLNDWTKAEEIILNVTGSYRTVFQLECKLPDFTNGNQTFALEYKVGVKMDEQDYSHYFLFVALDTTCQQYNTTGQAEYSVQDGFCFIDRNCVSHKTKKTNNECYECNYQKNVFDWHPSSLSECSVSSGNENDSTGPVVWKVVAGILSGVALVLLGICGIIYFKAKCSGLSRIDSDLEDFQSFPTQTDSVMKMKWNMDTYDNGLYKS